jgi:hypothetical protein
MPDKTPENPELASRLQKTEKELKDLQHSVKTGMIDVRVLMEFRHSIERARQASSAVQRWLEETQKGGDPFALLPRVMTERMRIATELLRDITHDVEGGDVDFDTPGLVELHQALKTIQERMVKFFPG